MASLKSHLFNFVLKRRMKPRPFHLVPPEKLRSGTDAIAPKRIPDDIRLDVVDENGVKGEWHRPDNADPARTILYLHGGGYVFGSAKSHRGLTFKLARETRAEVFSLNYRLAPENPFPAAVDDALAAYKWLLGQGQAPETLAVSGDSAGGGLSLALMLAAKAEGAPLPGCCVLYSPWTDLTGSGVSLDTNEDSDVMFKKVYLIEGSKRYTGGAEATNPLISPLFGDLGGLPPILTFISDSEVLLDDSVRLHEKLQSAGVRSELITERGLAHVWPIFYPRFPEARRSIMQSARFINDRFEGKGRA